jgi:hypothetical protein
VRKLALTPWDVLPTWSLALLSSLTTRCSLHLASTTVALHDLPWGKHNTPHNADASWAPHNLCFLNTCPKYLPSDRASWQDVLLPFECDLRVALWHDLPSAYSENTYHDINIGVWYDKTRNQIVCGWSLHLLTSIGPHPQSSPGYNGQFFERRIHSLCYDGALKLPSCVWGDNLEE